MSFNLRYLFSLSAVLLLIPVASGNSQDVVAATAESAADDEANVGSKEESFPLPDELKTPQEYLDLVEKLSSENEPEEQSLDGLKKFNKKLAHTIIKLGEKVLSLKPSEQEELQANFLQLQALQVLDRMNEPGAAKEFEKLVDDMRKDKRSKFQTVGMKFFVETAFSKWPLLSKDRKKTTLTVLQAHLAEGEAGAAEMNLVLSLIQTLDQWRDLELIKPLLDEMTPHFEKSENPNVVSHTEILRGLIRRLELPGKEMELSGALLDGAKLDWKSYRGKVVLVDFWATWCGPCQAELPNVLRLYKRYHDKGFEVLGICLDDDKDVLESYIKQSGMPWPNVISLKAGKTGFDHPMAARYGVTGIPLTILVNAEGKVVSLDASGEELAKLLKELLGKPEPKN